MAMVMIHRNLASCTWFVIALAHMLVSFASGEVYIYEVGGTHKGKYFTLGRQIQFECVYNKYLFKLVSFEHNGSVIDTNIWRYFESIGGKSDKFHALIVSNTLPTDAGIWSCTLRRLRTGQEFTVYTEIVYEEPILPTGIVTNLAGKYGEQYDLSCKHPSITEWIWTTGENFHKSRIDRYVGRVRLFQKGLLRFESLRFQDAGFYTCFARNLRTTISWDIYTQYYFAVYENVSMKITKGLTRGYVTPGKQLQFTCEYDHDLKFITFEHNGTEISSGNRNIINVKNTSNTSLVISNTQPTDAGTWSCVIQKPGNRKYSLQVIVKYVAHPEVRLVKEPFSELEIGQRVTLTCVVTAYKLWHVVWTKESDGTPVIGDYSREDNLDDITTRSILHFKALTEAQQDIYRCTAINIVGSSYQRISLNVSLYN